MHSSSQFPGLHDYAVEFLRQYRPAVHIWPLKRFYRWFQFLKKKSLPLTGWDYVFSDSQLSGYDVWLSLSGNGALPITPPPKRFPGMKVHHVMDYSHGPKRAGNLIRDSKIDYLLGYSSHDRWCGFFRHCFPDFTGRVFPIPFGFSQRFSANTPFDKRLDKCSVMGAVNPVKDPLSHPDEIAEFMEFFRDEAWAHAMRAGVRLRLSELNELVANFMAVPPEMRNVRYDSVLELNRHKLFLNDDSIMHYPPARAYEAPACGAVMVASDHPVYTEFGWHPGVNYIAHQYPDVDSFAAATRKALADQAALAAIQKLSHKNALRFSHSKVADGLHRILNLLWEGKTEDARNYWISPR